jgi:post-segregation antitoxin (ccd killing protein)
MLNSHYLRPSCELNSHNNHQAYNIKLALVIARVQMQMAQKRNVVLYLDKDLVEKTREIGLNLSKTFENHLKMLLTQLSTVYLQNNCENIVNGSQGEIVPTL